MERKDIDVKFNDLLVRNVQENDEGELVVKIGSHMYSYHPRFALYLTAAVPLELEGKCSLFSHVYVTWPLKKASCLQASNKGTNGLSPFRGTGH